ncbi:MAG: hypothetical protein DDT33_01207 [Firmicutes bacterium]|nr:hypothetical protein [Bacillota bacterium]
MLKHDVALQDPPVIPGINFHVTGIYDYLTCPRMYQFKVVQGLAPKTENVKLSFGRGMHHALAVYYQSRSSTTALAEYQVWLAEQQTQRTQEQLLDKTWANVARIGEPLLTAYLDYAKDDDFVAEAVEQPFQVPIWQPTCLDKQMFHDGQPVFHMGTFDGVVRNSYGKLWLIEHKTAQTFPMMSFLKVDLQIGLYLLAARQLYEEEICGVVYNVLRKVDPTKAKTPVVGRWLLSRTPQELKQAVEVLYRTVLRILNDTVYDPSPGFHCGWKCGYNELCFCLQDGGDIAPFVKQLYINRKEEFANDETSND